MLRHLAPVLLLAACSRPAPSLKESPDAGQGPAPAEAPGAAGEAPADPPEPPAPPPTAQVTSAGGTRAARPEERQPLVPLAELDVPDNLKALLEKLKNPDDEKALRKSFEALKPKGSVEALVKALTVLEPNVRSLAAFVLRRMKVHTPELTAALNRMLLSDPDPDVRGMVARNMVFYLDKDTVPPLIEALEKDESESVRMHAAWALGAIGDHRAVDPLIKAMEDPQTDVRLRAVNSVQRLKAQRAAPYIVARLDDSNLVVRGRAREALVSLTGKDLGSKASAWRAIYPEPK